jgi:hypothetical protein
VQIGRLYARAIGKIYWQDLSNCKRLKKRNAQRATRKALACSKGAGMLKRHQHAQKAPACF